jgi:nitroreductase
VPNSVAEQLLDLARHAPSSMNGQPWHFILVRRPTLKRALAKIKNQYCPAEKAAYRADFMENALVLIVCVEKESSHDRDVENAVLAAAIFMLAAHARGLSSVYMSAYQKGKPGLAKDISKLFRLPRNVVPVTILPFGYPAVKPRTKELRDLKEMIHHERF